MGEFGEVGREVGHDHESVGLQDSRSFFVDLSIRGEDVGVEAVRMRGALVALMIVGILYDVRGDACSMATTTCLVTLPLGPCMIWILTNILVNKKERVYDVTKLGGQVEVGLWWCDDFRRLLL